MYSSLGLIKNSKQSGKLIGTHQKLDKIARRELSRLLPKKTYFPLEKEILNFEGSNGPDGLKRKSPGIDEPNHFILPENDDKTLITIILNHQYNLKQALKAKNEVRAAFEAAWLAHALTDGLTPAHHYPYEEKVEALMSEKDYKKFFGVEIKGIMRGKTLKEATRNNWLYWGAGGIMTKHIAFEYGVATTVSATPAKRLAPKLKKPDLKNLSLKEEFYKSLEKIHILNMYNRFLKEGWTTKLIEETREILIPETIKLITLAWLSAM
ncbi:hypothetical protein FACS1894191_1320 [Clostridia bacterium]|nr:hypothetical protein FACS1894191_1320 [Clostridia bacterium]